MNRYQRIALITALAADLTFNICWLISERKRDQAWRAAVSDDFRRIRKMQAEDRAEETDGASTVGD